MPLVYTLLGGYLLLMLAMFTFQRTLMYPASSDVPDPAVAAAGGFQVVTTATADGLRLTHWYKKPARPGAATVVLFHGNAGHLGHRASKFAFLLDQGFGLMLAGYRGYGGNPGRPNEADLTADGRVLLDWLEAEGLTADRLVLYGESLGSGLAVKLAAERPVAAVILEAPYTSIAAVAQRHYWYLPAYWLVRDRWESKPLIDKIGAPLLVLHGERDRVIPITFGRELLAAAREPKTALFLDGAGHNDLLEIPEAESRIVGFLRDVALAQ